MNEPTLRLYAVRFIAAEAGKIVKRPHQLSFPAKHVADKIGGYAGTLGKVADEVAADLCASGIQCAYYRNRRPTVFVIDLQPV